MARPRGGLGRGLSAVFEAPPDHAEQEQAGRPVEIELDRIRPNSRQPRRQFDPDRLAELVRSVRHDGVVQPVVVRAAGAGRYELIAGERRWRAARAAGLATVPAVVRDAGDGDALVLALVENVVREDLNAVEVARGYAALVDEGGLAPAAVAERVGRSRSSVVNTLRLLELPDEVLELVASGSLSEGHGRAILQAPDHEGRRALAARVVQGQLSVRQTEALARSAGAAGRRPRTSAEWLDEGLAADVVDACYRAFGAGARVTARTDGCRVELTVDSPEQLTRLLERLRTLDDAQP